MTAPPRAYADHVVDYAQAGWPCILPVPPLDKYPPPVGFTGAEGADTDPLQLVAWVASHPGHAIALRMPETVIGIDVDQYVKGGLQKNGAATFAAALEKWGPLPATWTSTAREPGGPSRIYFFRVPPRRYATKLGADVEIIQRHHRYAVVWPSSHKDAGTYTWYGPDGVAADHPPKPDEFPELPPAWVEGLSEGATEAGPAAADAGSGQILLEQLLADDRPECADITSARLTALDELGRADAGSRHDTMTGRVHHLVQLAAGGHTGVAFAVAELRGTWAQLTAGEDRGEELERMLLTSARKAVTVVGTHQVPRDPCSLVAGGVPLPAPPAGAGGAPDPELQIAEPPRWVSVRQVIGTHAFDPVAGLDQTLAERVLERVWPALRYAYDSGGWLLRAPDHWELYRRLSPWAVAQVAPLMPIGDPTAEKGSEQHERSKRRARFMTAAGAGAIAKMMDALVTAGTHPAAVALADLDADPEVLWAGGMPFSLRTSREGPAFADVDPATPHTHTAGVLPETRPTPLWDAFLAAVWPDPELRRWAVRVLAIAVTGYADRALPILLGETGRGKTQVVHLLISVLGSYAHAANPKLLKPNTNEHDAIVFDLKGRRLSFIDEAPSERKEGQERLKQLTGGGELTGRAMNQNPVTFRPTHTFILTANPESEPVLIDPAVRARVRLIPCEGDPELVRVTRAAIGHVSSPAWRAEAPGVLAKLMAEAAGWLADPTTASVAAAPENIRYLAENLGAEQDPVAVWVAEETEPNEEGSSSRELYQAFVASCRRNSMRSDVIPSETKWGRSLTRLGYPPRHTEHGKRRPLRIGSSGGFLPGMPPMSGPVRETGQANGTTAGVTPGETPNPDGFNSAADGSMTGSADNASATFPQVNPGDSVLTDGSDGLREEVPTREHPLSPQSHSGPGSVANPSAALFEVPESKPPAKKRQQTEAAREKRARASAEKRAAAIAEAAGAPVRLPAVVTRDGAVRPGDPADADALLATISGRPAGELTVDVENTGYPVGHEHYALRTVQLGNEHFAVVLDPLEHDQADVARRHLAAAAMLHAHSATADLVPLAEAGLVDPDEAWAKMYDTAIPAKLSDPASTGNDADLKGLARSVLRADACSPGADEARAALFKAGKWLVETKVTTPLERSGWAQVDPGCATMVRYAASDVLDDAAIAARLPRLPAELWERERTVQRMVARISHDGIRLDGEQIQRLVAEHTQQRAAFAEQVRAYGVENPGSDQQVGEAFARLGVLLPRTKTGRPSVAAAVLEPMRDQVDLARVVLDYRHHDTALVLMLEPYRELVVRGDGRARPTVYTLGADTGRMSCVRPNLQQVSREGGLRACFTADPGHLLISADFSGVELRVAAALSQDRDLAAIVMNPERDLHWEVARLAFGPEATKAQRYRVKRGVFGRIYGGGVPAVAAGVGVDHATAKRVIDAMDALTPGLTEWSRMVRASVEAGHTQFPAYSGRVIHLPKGSPHAGPNYCIQGTARELLMDALLRWRETRWGEAVLFPVHDEIVAVIPEDEAEAATAALAQCMTSELHGIPIVADPSTPSFSWADSA